MPGNQMRFPGSPVLGSGVQEMIHQLWDLQQDTLSFLVANQVPREIILEYLSRTGWEELAKGLIRIDAETQGTDMDSRNVEPSELSWDHLIPAELDLDISRDQFGELGPEDNLFMPGDASGMTFSPVSCGFTLSEQTVGQFHPFASSVFLEPAISQQTQPVTSEPPSPVELGPSFGASQITEGLESIQEHPRAISSGYVSEVGCHSLTAGDPFFQYFNQLAAEMGPFSPRRSRFFPTTSVDETFDTASSCRGAGEYSEHSDEPCELALSDSGDDENTDQQNKTECECAAETTIQLPTVTLFRQHLPGGIFDALRSGGGPAP